MKITNDVRYIGVNDRKIDLFEGQYVVPNGMAYNSYIIMDKKIAVMDTVDAAFTHEWLDNLQNELGGRTPDYLSAYGARPLGKHRKFRKGLSDRLRSCVCQGI